MTSDGRKQHGTPPKTEALPELGTERTTPLFNSAHTRRNGLVHRRSLREQIYTQMEAMLEFEPSLSEGHTVRDELGIITRKAYDRIKAVLDAPAIQNERVSAEVAKILAEAEKLYAERQKLVVETESLRLENSRARMDFIRDLQEMAKQLERDDRIVFFYTSFNNVTSKLSCDFDSFWSKPLWNTR